MKTVSVRRQRGMALLISLVVLIVVSILGTTAMRSALFQSKISVNTQAAQMQFQGAESGIESVLQYSMDQIAAGIKPQMAGHIFYEALTSGEVQRVCYSKTGALLPADNKAERIPDGDQLIINYTECPQRTGSPLLVTTIVTVPPSSLGSSMPLEGTNLCGNNASCYGATQIYTRSFATIAGLNNSVKSHVQMWGIISPSGN